MANIQGERTSEKFYNPRVKFLFIPCQAEDISPGKFIWFYISVTEHHLMNRDGHECEVDIVKSSIIKVKIIVPGIP